MAGPFPTWRVPLIFLAMAVIVTGCDSPGERDRVAASASANRATAFAGDRFAVQASFLLGDAQLDLREFSLDCKDADEAGRGNIVAAVAGYKLALEHLQAKLLDTSARYQSLTPPAGFADFDTLFRQALDEQRDGIADAARRSAQKLPVAESLAYLTALSQTMIDRGSALLSRASAVMPTQGAAD